MRGKQVIVRAALVCGAAGIVCVLWSATDATAAHAAERIADPLPGTVELADALADAAGHTAEQLPTRVPKRVATTVAATVQPLTKTPPLPAKTPEVPDARTDRPTPVVDPAPAAPEAVPAVALLAGPAPSTVTLDPTQADPTAPAAASALLCGDHDDEPATRRPDSTDTPSGTPCTPDGRDGAGLAQVPQPTKTGGEQLAATAPSGPAAPALLLLGELLPRSDLPTGRTTPPEPGPA